MSNDQKMPDVIYADPPERQKNWPSGDERGDGHHVECTTNRWSENDTPYARIPEGIELDDVAVTSHEYLANMQAKVVRLTARGIEDMQQDLAAAEQRYAALVEAVSGLLATLDVHDIECLDCDGKDERYCGCLSRHVDLLKALAQQDQAAIHRIELTEEQRKRLTVPDGAFN